jgi:hypothetical protein
LAQDIAFVTGDGPVVVSDAAPDVVVVDSVGRLYTYNCVDFEFEVTVDSSSDDAGLLVHDLGDAGGLSGVGPRIIEFDARIPGISFGDSFVARFAAVRLDGSLSQFGPPVALAIPGDGDCDGVDDDHDVCPAEAGVSETPGLPVEQNGCPSSGSPQFRCSSDGSRCQRDACFGGGIFPTCADEGEGEGGDDDEDDDDAPGDGGCAGAPAASLWFLLLLGRRVRTTAGRR